MRFRDFLLFWLFVGKSKFKSGFETDRGGKSILWTKVCGILPLHIAGGGDLFFTAVGISMEPLYSAAFYLSGIVGCGTIKRNDLAKRCVRHPARSNRLHPQKKNGKMPF